MKVKGRFAPIREGLLEHLYGMTPMECKVYLAQHLMATRSGPGAGTVVSSLANLANVTGHKRDHIRRALVGLEEKDYIQRLDGGWLILNFNGENPANTLARNGPGPKGATNRPERGHPPGPKGATPLARKGPDRDRKSKKEKPDSLPLNDLNDKKDVNGSYRRGAPADWPGWYPGITWNKKSRKVEMTSEAHECLSEHLRELAEQEGLPLLTRREAQRAWGRLNGWVMRNRQCSGPKSLPPIAVNWFENDLRDPNRIRGPTKRQGANDAFDEAIRKAEEEDLAKREDEQNRNHEVAERTP